MSTVITIQQLSECAVTVRARCGFAASAHQIEAPAATADSHECKTLRMTARTLFMLGFNSSLNRTTKQQKNFQQLAIITSQRALNDI